MFHASRRQKSRWPAKLRLIFASCCLLSVAFIAHAAPPLAAYGRLAAIEHMSLAPSGARFAYIALLNGKRVFVVRDSGGEALFASDVGDSKVRDVFWADDDHVLVEVSSTFKAPIDFKHAYELSAVISVSVPERRTFRVFEGKRSIASAVFGYFGSGRVDDRSYGYFGGITYAKSRDGAAHFEDGYPDLYRVDLDSGKAVRVDKGDGRYFKWLVGSDGRVLAHSEYNDETGLFQIYAGEGRGKLLMERDDPFRDLALQGIGRQPATLLYSDSSGSYHKMIELGLEDGASTELCGQGVGTLRPVHNPDQGQLLGCVSDMIVGSALFDSAHGQRLESTRKAFPGLEVELRSHSRNFERVIVFTDGGKDSGTYWLVDIGNRKALSLGRAYPEIAETDVAPTSWFDYKAADGLAMQGVLTLPPGHKAERLPLVVMPHGGPIGVRDAPGFDWWAQAFASRGYAVFQPNYRGSAGYSVQFLNAGIGEWGAKILSDVADGVSALAGAGIVDPARVCIVGASYGGYAALAGVTVQHGLYRCAVSVAGPSDLVGLLRWKGDRSGERSATTRYLRAAFGVAGIGDERLTGISPARHAESADAPVLLIHGKDDVVIPFEQSRTMAEALERAGQPYEIKALEGEDHWLSREDTRIRMLDAAIDFVQRHNPTG